MNAAVDSFLRAAPAETEPQVVDPPRSASLIDTPRPTPEEEAPRPTRQSEVPRPAQAIDADESASALHALGLMRIGDAVLALPVAALREVVPCPARLEPLPAANPAVGGAVRLRGTVIPVLDLGPVLGLAAADGGSPVIVIMRWSGRLLGLKADGVCGMATVAGRCLHRLVVGDAAGCASPVTHAFEQGDGIATLLDAGRIAGLPGVPMVQEPTAQAGSNQRGVREPVLLFRTGGLPFAISALRVDATVPRCDIRRNALTNALCRGVIDHHGTEVPVVDTLALLGLRDAGDATESAVLVLRFPNGRVGLTLDAVSDIAPIDAADVLSLPALAVQRPALFRGVLVGDGLKQHLLLDADALQRDPVLEALAGLKPPRAAGTAAVATGTAATGAGAANDGPADAAPRSGASYLTYEVGIETASPLVQVVEILTYPHHATPLRNGRAEVLGLFIHRGAAVPLVCLGSVLGRPTVLDRDRARVLLVQEGRQTIGFVVQALRSIETARWEQTAASGAAAAAPTLHSVKRFQPLVEVGSDGLRRTLPRLDLGLLIRALANEHGGGAPATVDPVAVEPIL